MLKILLISTALAVGCAQQRNPISAPTAPWHRVGVVSTPGMAMHLTVLNDTVYIADYMAGVAVVSLENRVLVKSIPSSGEQTVWVSKISSQIVVAKRSSAYGDLPYEMYRLSNDTLQHFFGSSLSGATYAKFVTQVTDTNMHYIACNPDGDGYTVKKSIWSYYPESGWFLQWQSTSPYSVSWAGCNIRQVVLEQPLCYAAAKEYGLLVLSQPDLDQAPITLSHLDLPGSSYWLTKKGNVIYVAIYGGAIAVVDVSHPAAPIVVKLVPLAKASQLKQVEVSGRWLFVLDGYDGVYVFDIINPQNPVLACLLISQRPNYMEPWNDLLLVADKQEGLLIFQ